MNNAVFAIGMPGGAEWFWIFMAVVVLFGAKKIPDLARGLGRSVGEFRRAKDEFESELTRSSTESKTTAVTPSASVPIDSTKKS